ncbi:MAG: anthranilate synthase component I [Clostridiales bacterium]|nr:anthranilate synthase component I [Clostridiales bacterium]
MINITEEQFKELKSKKKIFSIISMFRGDEITPITIFSGMKGNRKFILEGGSKENRFGRYSFLGEDPYFEVVGNTKKEILEVKKEVSKDFDSLHNPFPFKGGAVGYMGYDTASFYEKKLEFKNNDDLDIPVVRFNFYKRYITFDHFTHKVYIVDNVFNDDTRSYENIIKEQKDYFRSLLNINYSFMDVEKGEKIKFQFATEKDKFIENVKKAKEYIKSGDIFQVVLSQRMYCETEKTPLEIYRRLREDNPSPYMFFLDYNDYQVVGSSPESLVAKKGEYVITNPIAGTRRRGKNEEEDRKLEEELLGDIKERAEHVMLVDLGRNDIGKVSKIGSVEVKDFMKVERFSHVMHITSQVVGKIRSDKDAFDALVACLPAGTVSGAPKIRAMEIIEELEDVKRGVYSGTAGYFSFGGDMDMCIAIRTFILKGNMAYLQAGAGIVYDSIPENEFEEIQNKLLALKEALR